MPQISPITCDLNLLVLELVPVKSGEAFMFVFLIGHLQKALGVFASDFPTSFLVAIWKLYLPVCAELSSCKQKKMRRHGRGQRMFRNGRKGVSFPGFRSRGLPQSFRRFSWGKFKTIFLTKPDWLIFLWENRHQVMTKYIKLTSSSID